MRCRPGWFLLGALRENLFCASVLVSGGCWPSLACSWITPVYAPGHTIFSVSRSSLSSLQGYLSLDWEPTLNPRWSHLESLNYIFKDPFFPDKFTFTGSRGLGLGTHHLGATIHPTVNVPSTVLSILRRSAHSFSRQVGREASAIIPIL